MKEYKMTYVNKNINMEDIEEEDSIKEEANTTKEIHSLILVIWQLLLGLVQLKEDLIKEE